MINCTEYPISIRFCKESGKLKLFSQEKGFQRNKRPILTQFVSDLKKLKRNSFFCFSASKAQIRSEDLKKLLKLYNNHISARYVLINRCPVKKNIPLQKILLIFVENHSSNATRQTKDAFSQKLKLYYTSPNSSPTSEERKVLGYITELKNGKEVPVRFKKERHSRVEIN